MTDSTPAATNDFATQIAWLCTRAGTQKALADTLEVTPRTVNNWVHGRTVPLPRERQRVHELAAARYPDYPDGAGAPPLWRPDPSPIPRARRRRRWWLGGIGASAVVAAVLLVVAQGPDVEVTTPTAGTVVDPEEPFNGQLDGDLPRGWAVWGATLAPGGTYYSQDRPCDVAPDGSVVCNELYVGREGVHGEAWQVCLFVVSDSGFLEDYANRPNPRTSFPGFDEPPSATEAMACVPVTT